MKVKAVFLTLIAGAGLALAAGPAAAAPGGNQGGDSLVNVQISDVILAVPVSAAANLCDINVNVLADQVDAGDATCDATAESAASPGFNGGGGNQAGNSLVNVQLDDIEILVPISLAANLCDVNVNVLAQQLNLDEASCEATAESLATP